MGAGSPAPRLTPALSPSAGLWGPGVDPGRLIPGAHPPDPGLGDVCVRVLLPGHHNPPRPVHNWCPRRGDFLGHPGESQPGMFEVGGWVLDPLHGQAGFSRAGGGCPVDES